MQKFLKICVGLVLCAILLMVRNDQLKYANGPGYDVTCTQVQQYSSSTPVACQIEPSKKQTSTRPFSPWWDIFFTWPEGVTSLLLLSSLIAILWQSNETRKAAESSAKQAVIAHKAMIHQFRPKIHVRAIHLNETEDFLKVEIILTNKGGTPGHIHEAVINIAWVYIHTAEEPEISKTVMDPFSLQPGEDAPLEIDLSAGWVLYRMANIDLERTGKQSQTIRCDGLIRYKDDNGVLRRTAFRRIYDIATSHFIESANDPEHEYAD